MAAARQALMVGEVGQGVAALAVYPRAWAKVGGQPVPQPIFEEAQGGEHALCLHRA